MDNPILYRKRIIPDECVLLKDDIIISCDEDRIVTKWNALHPKKDLHHGASCYFLKEGFKVSKFCKEDDSLMYWYCDIVDFHYEKITNELIVTDLLADVIIYPDGFVKVVDIDEMVEALESRSISLDTLKTSLVNLDRLLSIIYSENFDSLTKYINEV
ncbi:MAG: DUF402 domain-containing protein [Lachnospiraceae bacterium]|nr:DUF402 domain-containing protein [Lachnospiraceae bacterium]